MDWSSPKFALAAVLLAHMPTLAVAIFHYYSPFVRRVAVVGLLGATASAFFTLWLARPFEGVVSYAPSNWLQPLTLQSNWIFWTVLNLYLFGYLLFFFRNKQPVSYPVKRVCFLTGLTVSLLLVSGSLNLFSFFLGSVLLTVCYSFFLGNVGDFEDYQAIGVLTWRNGCADILGLFALATDSTWGLPIYLGAKTIALAPFGVWPRPSLSIWGLYALMLGAFVFPALRLGISPWVLVGGTGIGVGLGLARVNELALFYSIGTALGNGLARFELALQFLLALPLRGLKAGWVVVSFMDDAPLKASLLVSLVVATIAILLFG